VAKALTHEPTGSCPRKQSFTPQERSQAEVRNGYITRPTPLLLAPQLQLPIRVLCRRFVIPRGIARTLVLALESLVMKGSPVRVRASA